MSNIFKTVFDGFKVESKNYHSTGGSSFFDVNKVNVYVNSFKL